MGVQGVFHPVISVTSLEDALAFYRDLLGLRLDFVGRHDAAALSELFDMTEPVADAVTLVCPDGSEIEFVQWTQPPGRPAMGRSMEDAGLAAVNLRVTDIGRLVAELDAAGYTDHSPIVAQPMPDGSTIEVAACRGPDGTMVILVELPPGKSSL